MSARTPEISIVMTCSNDARVLPGCLESLFGQTSAPNFEVLIVDDASTDGTGDVLDAINDSRVRVVRHARHRGQVACVNEAVPLTRGEIVARVDPTHRCQPELMRSISDRLRRQRPASDTSDEFISLLARDFVSGPVFATRRKAWCDALPVPQGLACSDWYVALRAARRGSVCYVSAAADQHRHAENPELTLARTRSEERSVFWLLDRVFEQVETTPELERAKRRARGMVYATQFQNFAERYLGFGCTGEARRCFVAAVRHRPVVSARSTSSRPSKDMALVRAVR